MKNLKRILALIAALIITVGAFPAVSAITPYSTYTYDIDGTYMESPHAYVPYEVINSETLGLKVELKEPGDFYVYNMYEETYLDNGELRRELLGNYICISDTGNGRVIIAQTSDEDGKTSYKTLGIIRDFTNEWGVKDSITDPHGLATDKNGYLYVCDTSANRIVVFDIKSAILNGEGKREFPFVKTIMQPEGDVFAEGTTFKPVAVSVDNAGRIYVVSSASYQGIISMTGDGQFSAFLGATSNSLTVWEMLWRNLQTSEQKKKTVKNVSVEYNNITIDDEGFIYVTTSALSASDQLQAIISKSKSGDKAPVKKLNPTGNDVMMRTGFYPPSGEVTVQSLETPMSKVTGPSTVVDVALGPDGIWSIIDSKRNKIYTYDEEGRLLYIFGDQGDQLGNIQTIKAVDYLGTSILALDKLNKNITIYKRTEYGDLLAKALQNQRDRKYDESVNDWTNILQRNSNFDMSYIGIGKSYYRQGKWQEAMDMYKYAYDTTNYSDAYHEKRKETLSKMILVVPLAVVLIGFLLSKFLGYANKKNVEGQSSSVKRTLWREYLYGYHVIFHPFDGFYDIKHEHRAGVKGATLILVLTIISFIYQSVGKGYIMAPEQNSVNFLISIISILLPVFLWIVANWCLTTLFDGEGSVKDIYIATCYALFPLSAFIIVTTFFSNFVTLGEVSIINLFLGIAYFWVGFLLFFGMMTIHDYSLGKNILTTIGSIVGMAFIMFVVVLFSSLVGKIVSFIYNIGLELSYRM